MKKLVLLLMLIVSSNGIWAMCSVNPADSVNIPLKGTQGGEGGSVHRTSALRLVRAVLCNSVLTISFTSSTPNAKIIISDEWTGEVECTEECNTSSAIIDLESFGLMNGRNYVVEISTPSWCKQGTFDY